jgi:hypothetical protein
MRLRMRYRLLFTCTAFWLAASSAQAAEEAAWEDPTHPTPAVRRSGFTAGLSGGVSMGRAYGYPNEAEKIDRREFLANTKFGLSTGSTLWLGGALTDWFTVGIGMLGTGVRGNGLVATGGAFVFHLETFPFFYAGKAGQNLGLLANFGAGSVAILRKEASKANGGNMSCVGLGAFYEPLRFWRFSAGPSLEGTYMFSPSLRSLTMTAAMRLVFYGGP